MPEQTSSENTLPSLGDIVSSGTPRPQIALTVVFHPRTERIGARASLAFESNEVFTLGRYAPLFEGCDIASPLDDPYVSRQALLLKPEGTGLRVCRPQAASRCRMASGDLFDEVYLDESELRIGVPLLLAHSVVLLLRLEDGGPPGQSSLPDCGLVGSGAAVHDLREQILRAARSEQDVLVRGETGTGKELVASAIHALGNRSRQPLVRVNMAAIPPGLAASSLFGSDRGAYTGAARSRQGYFQQAEGGILFLDEIGDTPPDVQPLLLRALQEREIQCVGGKLLKIDVRVISATDQPLADEREGCFRPALRYRLGAVEIAVPPLRERPEDIGLLLLHFLRRAESKENLDVLSLASVTEADSVARWANLFYAFLCYDWPGNVRELGNYATQVVLASGRRATLPAPVTAAFSTAEYTARSRADSGEVTVRRLGDVDDEEFARVMDECRYEVAAVAQVLGVSRQSVYRRINGSPDFRLVCDVSAGEIRRVIGQCAGDVRAAADALSVSETALRARLRSGELAT